jgi:MoaA/NifB/PqqE/SkfB family radical SAM enzyme
MPVFTADKQLSHIIGDYRGSTDFDTLYNQSRWYLQSPTSAIMNEKHDRKINCVAKNGKEIYVAANGEVYPCCWTGFYPLNSNRNSSNVQLKPLIKNNNALTYGIEEAIRWFNQIEESWKYTVPKGKIFACNENCGTRK